MYQSVRTKTFFTFLMILLMFSACGPSKEEKLLEGTWVGQQTEIDEDGDEVTYRYTLNFDYDKSQAEVIMDLIYPGIGKIARIEMQGDWMADEDEISYFFDDDKTSITFTGEAKSMAALMGVSLSEFEDLLESEVVEETELISTAEILSIDESTLKLDLDGPITLHRQ